MFNLWFDEENQKVKLTGYLPKGRAYKQAYIKGSNFYKVMDWFGSAFKGVLQEFNRKWKGLYICESTELIEEFKTEYAIPNNVFYQTDVAEHQKDVFCIKYLMNGNSEWNYRAIANLYGIDVIVTSGEEYYRELSNIPNSIPHIIVDGSDKTHILIISLPESVWNTLPYDVPTPIGNGKVIDKIKKIYSIISSAEVEIRYLPLVTDINVTVDNNGIPNDIPHILGETITTTFTYKEVDPSKRITFCKEGI